MLQLNRLGTDLGKLEEVHAMTDVTGFGLLGHLNEMCESSGISALIEFESIPKLKNIEYYVNNGCIPGGTYRNFSSYGQRISGVTSGNKTVLCDPQTSGGLLFAVDPQNTRSVLNLLNEYDIDAKPIGKIVGKEDYSVKII
jgi:selenide,water dikinase